MTKETMTIHDALSELKTLDSRIERASSAMMIATKKHDADTINGVSVDVVIADIKGAFASAMDLMRRRDAIKWAVIKSNATTTIRVGEYTYTVAEAIDAKHSIEGLRNLYDNMASQFRFAQSTLERENGSKLEGRAQDHVRSLFPDGKNSAAAEKVLTAFIESQTVELVDPLDIKHEVEKIRTSYEQFVTKVDSALSTSNAITTIEIEY